MKKNILVIIVIVISFAVMLGIAILVYNNMSSDINAGNVVEYNNTGEIQDEESTSAPVTELASDFTFYDSDGNERTLSEFIGKPVVLNFWASWCGPCRAEMPYFDEAYKEYGDQIEFLIVNLTDGVQETRLKADNFATEMEFSFPIYYDAAGEGVKAYSIYYIPDTYFINKDGYINAFVQGTISNDDLTQCLEDILEK